MSYTSIRQALVSFIHTSWLADKPTVPVFYENTVKVDLDEVGDVFAVVEIDFTDTVQADLGPSPFSRYEGEVMVRVFSKDGTGTKAGLEIHEYVESLLQRKVVSNIVLETATPGRKVSKNGWLSNEIFVPFRFHSNT